MEKFQNPFNPRYPVGPRHFANRKTQIERFRKDLLYSVKSKPPRPENIAILGDWGIGKTSMLNKFADMALSELRDEAKCLVIKVRLRAGIKDMYEFAEETINQAYDSIIKTRSIKGKIKEDLFSWKVKQLQFGPIELEKKAKARFTKTSTSLLSSSLVELWEKYLEKAGIDIVLLMYDDLHYLVKSVKESVYDLRAVFQELPEYGCNYQLLVTGPATLFGEIRGLAEPLVRFFGSYELRAFNEKETEEAIRLPLERENIPLEVKGEVTRKVHEISQGHPYFIHFIMRDLFEARSKGIIDIEFFEQNYPSIFKHMRKDKFERDLDSASDKEKELLLKMANVKEDIISPNKIKGLKAPAIGKFLQRLTDKNLITRLARGKYKLYHPLFKEYLKGLK